MKRRCCKGLMLFLEAKGECTLDVICYTECMWNGKDNLVVVQINWDGQFQDLCLAHSIYCEWLTSMAAEFQELQIYLGDLESRYNNNIKIGWDIVSI